MLSQFGSGRIGKGKNVLGERKERIFRILRIGTHRGGRVYRVVDGGFLRVVVMVSMMIMIITFEARASQALA